MLLEGLYTPATTPFYPDGRVYYKKLEHNIGRLSRTPISGIVLLSETGEGDMLSDVESRDILTTAANAASDEKVLLANIGRPSVINTLELAESAATAGYDAVIVRVPQGIIGRELETLTYLRSVADSSPLPVIAYDPDGNALPSEWLSSLAVHPNLIAVLSAGAPQGILDAIAAAPQREVTVTTTFTAVTRRMLAVQPTGPATFVDASSLSGGIGVAVAPPRPAIKTRTKKVGLQVLTTHLTGLIESLRVGVSGAILPLSASIPQACFEAFAAWKDGDPALAELKQARIEEAQVIVTRFGVAGIKYGCDLSGYFGGSPRLPLLALNADQKATVESLLIGLKS